MIATIKDLKDFKLKINLKIIELKNNELAREWIKSNHKTATIKSDAYFIIKENEILVRVMRDLYVVKQLLTESEYTKQFKTIASNGK